MNKVDEKIVKFIKKHHVLTLATCMNGQPWCANCFYAYVDDLDVFVFTSDYETRHVKESKLNSKVSGSIVLETKIVGKIQGVQFSGQMYQPENEELEKAKSAYFKRFPFAMAMKTVFWVLNVEHFKLTDNTLGFGTKLIWNKIVAEGK
jgi:uncharacterized protein